MGKLLTGSAQRSATRHHERCIAVRFPYRAVQAIRRLRAGLPWFQGIERSLGPITLGLTVCENDSSAPWVVGIKTRLACTLGFLPSSSVSHRFLSSLNVLSSLTLSFYIHTAALSLARPLRYPDYFITFIPPNAIMHFQSLTILSIAAFAVALPASLQTRQAGVLKATTFNDISIAGGQAGNAEAEAAAAFSALNLNDLANVSKADLDFLNEVNQVANDAEKEAFNPAVEAATGAAADAVQVSTSTHQKVSLA